MPLIVKCNSCGYVLYNGKQLKMIDEILRLYGYRCPCCLSILVNVPTTIKVSVNGKCFDNDVYRLMSNLKTHEKEKREITCSICNRTIRLYEPYIGLRSRTICLKCLLKFKNINVKALIMAYAYKYNMSEEEAFKILKQFLSE